MTLAMIVEVPLTADNYQVEPVEDKMLVDSEVGIHGFVERLDARMPMGVCTDMLDCDNVIGYWDLVGCQHTLSLTPRTMSKSFKKPTTE